MSLCSNGTSFSRRAIQGRWAKGQTPEFQRTIFLFDIVVVVEKLLAVGESAARRSSVALMEDIILTATMVSFVRLCFVFHRFVVCLLLS